MGNYENRQFIEKICNDHWKELYRFVYYKVQNREEAEDITQESYAKAIAYLKDNPIQVRDYANYLKTIAMNIIRDNWRSKSRKGSCVNLEEVDPEVMATEDFAETVAERTRMEESLKHLTKEQQTVIDLRIIHGYSLLDTAKLMNKKIGAVKVLQYRAIKALSLILDAQGGKES